MLDRQMDSVPLTHKFKYTKDASWGIVLNISAEIVNNDDVSQMTHKVNNMITLCINNPMLNSENQKFILLNSEIEWLIRGLKMVSDQAAMAISSPINVCVRSIDIAECDYQEEGLACCIAEWLGKKLNFQVPTVPISYCREQNRYVFEFPNHIYDTE